MLFICYEKCSTCKKARSWLEDNGLPFIQREISVDNPTAEELKQWHQLSGLPLRRFFNTSGILYREQNLKDKLPLMTEAEQYQLLSTNGMLVKRPILINDDTVLVGFRELEWSKLLL